VSITSMPTSEIALLGPTSEYYVDECMEFIKNRGKICTSWTYSLSQDKIVLLKKQIESEKYFHLYFQISKSSGGSGLVNYRARVIDFQFSENETPSPDPDYSTDEESAQTGRGWYTFDRIEQLTPSRSLESFESFDNSENISQNMFSRMRQPHSPFILVKDFKIPVKSMPEAVGFGNLRTLLEEKKQIIFYGPPGTGKTWYAKRFGELFLKEPSKKSE